MSDSVCRFRKCLLVGCFGFGGPPFASLAISATIRCRAAFVRSYRIIRCGRDHVKKVGIQQRFCGAYKRSLQGSYRNTLSERAAFAEALLLRLGVHERLSSPKPQTPFPSNHNP